MEVVVEISNLCCKCFHEEENHKDNHICTGSLTCLCQHFEPPFLLEFAQEVEKFKHLHDGVFKRCKFILEKIPTTQNAGDKSFPKIYKEIFYGVKIRKLGTNLTYNAWRDMPSDDDINREKRRVKQHNPELRTYDKKILFEQTALYQAMMEVAIET